MDYRAAYVLGSAVFQLGLWLACAYFHNWWSVWFFIICAVSSEQMGKRITAWESRPTKN